MSVDVYREVWRHSRSEHGARLTLLALADNASKNEAIAYPGQPLLMEMTRLKERGLRDSLRWLEEEVEIETRQAMKRRTRINVYRVLLGEFAAVVIDPSNLPFRLLQPFSSPNQIATRRAAKSAGREEGPTDPTTGRNGGDDRQNPPLSKEGPGLDPETREPKNSSLVAADAAEGEGRVVEIGVALSAALGVQLRTLTRSERGAWERAVHELADVGATRDDVTARCAAYRVRWPEIALTPMALVRHWSLLGAAVEIASPTRKVEEWIDQTAVLFDPETAHELLDDRPGLADAERIRLHQLLDQRFVAGGEDEREVA